MNKNVIERWMYHVPSSNDHMGIGIWLHLMNFHRFNAHSSYRYHKTFQECWVSINPYLFPSINYMNRNIHIYLTSASWVPPSWGPRRCGGSPRSRGWTLPLCVQPPSSSPHSPRGVPSSHRCLTLLQAVIETYICISKYSTGIVQYYSM